MQRPLLVPFGAAGCDLNRTLSVCRPRLRRSLPSALRAARDRFNLQSVLLEARPLRQPKGGRRPSTPPWLSGLYPIQQAQPHSLACSPVAACLCQDPPEPSALQACWTLPFLRARPAAQQLRRHHPRARKTVDCHRQAVAHASLSRLPFRGETVVCYSGVLRPRCLVSPSLHSCCVS